MNPTATSDSSLRQQSIRALKIRQTLKWTALCTSMLLAMFAGTFTGKLYFGNRFVSTIFNKIIHGENPLQAFTPVNQFPDQHVINVLILGCDHDYSEVLPGKALKGSRGRSDAIMVARIDFDAPSITILSIPRDTAVRIPNKGIRKINSAYAIGGFELTQKTLQAVFGINVDFYATIDFEGFEKMVDAVGGVEVDVHKKLDYDDNWGKLHIHLKPGIQHLSGYTAMGYVRMRHSDSDFMRAKRQQEFLEALRQKVRDPRNLLRIPDALNALSESLSSNMTHDQMLALANFARALDQTKISLNTLPCFEGPSYVYINVPKSEELIRQIFPGTLVSIEAPDRKLLARASESYNKKHKSNDDDDTARLDNGEEIPTSKKEPRASNPDVDKQGHDAGNEPEPNKTKEPAQKTPDTDKPAPDKPVEKPNTDKPDTDKPAEPKPADPKTPGDKSNDKPTKPEDTPNKDKTPN